MFLNNLRCLVKPIITIPCRGVKVKAPRIKVGPQKYVPPPDQFPRLVRQESILKSLVLEDPKYPISLTRLDEIRAAPYRFVQRQVPPPELPFECRRTADKRFHIDVYTKRWRGKQVRYTTVRNVKGDIGAFKDCLKWRFGENAPMKVFDEKTIVVVGHYPREISMLLQGLGF